MRETRREIGTTQLIEKYRSEILDQDVESTRETTAFPSKFFENRISLSLTEFAVQTGLSVKSVERMVKRGEIQAKRVGRRLVIPTKAIEAWLNQTE